MSIEEKLKQSMDEAVMQTFAEMAFVDVLPADIPKIDHSQIMIIEITRPQRGVMYLLMPRECKQCVVENIHGDSWESLSVDQIDDCLLELLNVLGGNFLSRYYGEAVSYSVSFPQVVFDESELPDLESFSYYSYDAEGIPFAVALKMETQGDNV